MVGVLTFSRVHVEFIGVLALPSHSTSIEDQHVVADQKKHVVADQKKNMWSHALGLGSGPQDHHLGLLIFPKIRPPVYKLE